MKTSITIWMEAWEMKIWKVAAGGDGHLSAWVRENCNKAVPLGMEMGEEDQREMDELVAAFKREREAAKVKKWEKFEEKRVPGVPTKRIPVWRQGEYQPGPPDPAPEPPPEPPAEVAVAPEPKKPIRKAVAPRTRQVATHCPHNYILLPDGTTACPECKRRKRR
jgi:hypothetical protein